MEYPDVSSEEWIARFKGLHVLEVELNDCNCSIAVGVPCKYDENWVGFASKAGCRCGKSKGMAMLYELDDDVVARKRLVVFHGDREEIGKASTEYFENDR